MLFVYPRPLMQLQPRIFLNPVIHLQGVFTCRGRLNVELFRQVFLDPHGVTRVHSSFCYTFLIFVYFLFYHSVFFCFFIIFFYIFFLSFFNMPVGYFFWIFYFSFSIPVFFIGISFNPFVCFLRLFNFLFFISILRGPPGRRVTPPWPWPFRIDILM